MTAASAFGTPPVAWFALGTVPFLWFSRRLLTWMMAFLIVVLAAVSQDGAIFSPYNRIDLTPMEYSEAGVLEYSSMVLGLKAMSLLALGFYLASYLVAFRWFPRLESSIPANSFGNSAA